MGLFTRKYDLQPGSAAVPPARQSVFDVSPQTALSLTAVYRCVSILSTMIGQLPLQVHRGVEVVDNNLVKRPDVDSTNETFFGQTVTSLALRGEAFWWISRNQAGVPQNITVLDPSEVTVQITQTTRPPDTVQYYYRGSKVQKRNIEHITLFSLPGQQVGYGPIQAARNDLLTALKVREYGDDIFSNGAIPTGVLSSDQYLNQEQADAYRSAWAEAQGTRGLAVLGAGLEYTPIMLSPEEVQFLESQNYSTHQIARLFGIPPIYLGLGIEGSSLTYATTESLGILFIQTTLSQYLNGIEAAFTNLLPRGQEARFKVDALMRASMNDRVNAYEKLVGMGAMFPEEVRLSEGMDANPDVRYLDNAPGPDYPHLSPVDALQQPVDGAPI